LEARLAADRSTGARGPVLQLPVRAEPAGHTGRAGGYARQCHPHVDRRAVILFAHDLVRKPVPAFRAHARHLSPNQRVPIARKEKNPTISVTVVTKGLDATAGSRPRRLSASGIRMPPSAAAMRLQIIASPITTPSPGTLNQAAAAIPVMIAN